MLPAAWCVSPDKGGWGAEAAPVVVRVDSRKPPKVSEAALLAHRILARKTDDLLLDAKRRRELAREIEGFLVRLRKAYPEVAEIFARAAHRPGVLLLGVKPDLTDTVSRLLGDKKAPVKLRTGEGGVRRLKREDRASGRASVPPHGRPPHAPERASEHCGGAKEGVTCRLRESNTRSPMRTWGDGSDIEASKSGDAWHIVIRKAWGDCPAGCILQEDVFLHREG